MTSTIQLEKSSLRIVLMPINELRPHEKGSALYLELLKEEILTDRMLKYPIIADEKTHVILDGMHRWLALKNLGDSLIPVILVEAFGNTKIQVGRRRVHRYTSDPEMEIPIEEVISAGLSGKLMKPRSTRHFFPFSKFQQVNYPLNSLGKRKPQDVSEYLAAITGSECKLAIKDWLEEITEELDFLAKRKDEVEKEKTEFLNRIKHSENNGSPF